MNPPLTIDGLPEVEWAVLYSRARQDVGFTASDAVFNRRFRELIALAKGQA